MLKIKDFLPMNPGEGPPLPRRLGIRWPFEFEEEKDFRRMQAVKSPYPTGQYLYHKEDEEKAFSQAEKAMGKGITYSIWHIAKEDIPEWRAEGYIVIA